MGIDRAIPLYVLDRRGQIRILHLIAEPLRVLAVVQVVAPRLVVDAVGEEQEQIQVMRAQVELLARAAEHEAVRTEVALDVLARMPRALGDRRLGLHDRRATRIRGPEQRAAGAQRPARYRGRALDAGDLAELLHRLVGVLADDEQRVDRIEHPLRDTARMHGDIERAVRTQRQLADRVPARWQ